MKKYIITIFVFLGLVIGTGSVLALDVIDSNSLSIKEISKTGVLDYKIDSVNLTASLNVLDKNDYDKVFWQITNGNSTVVLECKVNYKASALPVLMIDSSVDDKSISNEGGCSVEWLLTAVEDGEYTITAKSFLNFDSRIVTSPYDSIAKFVMNTNGDLQSLPQKVIVDRTAPTITLEGKNEISVFVGGEYKDQGVIVSDNSKVEVSDDSVNVDSTKVDTYTITYTATDEAGNSASITRIVHVIEKPSTSESTLSIEKFSTTGYLNIESNKIVKLKGIIKSLDTEYKHINWKVTHAGDAVFSKECELISSSISDEFGDDFSGFCEVEWDTTELNDGEYQIIAESSSSSKISFESISIDSDSKIKKGNLNDEKEVTIDRTAPEITIAPYTTTSTRQDITVTATSNGELNFTSHTFTENGSFNFVAIDEAGNVTTKTVTITNINKSRGSSSGSYVGRVTFAPVAGQVLGAESYFFTLPLKVGSKGNEVVELQKFLNLKGFDSGLADGIFGPMTKASVIRFQLANNLVGDGIVGPLTRAVLNQ